MDIYGAQLGELKVENEITCPRCDELAAKVKKLEAMLGSHNDQIVKTFRLSPALSNLLGLLLDNEVVGNSQIKELAETEPKHTVHRLRAAMAIWSLKVVSCRGTGYMLEDGEKARLRSIMGEISNS